MEIETLFSGTIAHAYIFSKSDEAAVLNAAEKKFDIVFGGSQNAIKYAAENFGIEDSRAVTELGNLQSDGDTFVAIIARSLTAEAQHALLKTVEEPRRGVHYFIFVENSLMLLPTLRSRCICVSKGEEQKTKSKHPDFLSISLAERFVYIEKIAKSLKKDDPNAFRDAAMEIFDAVIAVKRESITSSNASQLDRILTLRNYLNDRGSSTKQLLETMAMQLS
jgi:DNA polymerase-3 subunit delta'